MNIVLPIPFNTPGNVLVPHAGEIMYSMGFTPAFDPPEEAELAIRMAQYWSNFAATANPNGEGQSPLQSQTNPHILYYCRGGVGEG
jgi:carboxylesterase type B